MTTIHKNLTGADLHEPKGADTALAGKVYVSDGAGSGAWTTASSIITNTAFTTGDLKATHKVTADTDWIMWSDGSIGDGSSSATIRANADTATLFALYWNNYSNALCPVSSGRGISAVADFAAHKRISVPLAAGRVFGLAGAGSGLTTRTVGQTLGVETYSLLQQDIPTLTSTVTQNISVVAGGNIPFSGSGWSPTTTPATGSNTVPFTSGSVGNQPATITGSNTITVTTLNTTGVASAHSLMQPTAFLNVMIKL